MQSALFVEISSLFESYNKTIDRVNIYGMIYYDSLSTKEIDMFASIFQCYVNYNYQFYIYGSTISAREWLEILTPEEYIEFKKYGHIRFIDIVECYEKLPKIYYKEFVNKIIHDLKQ